MADYTIINSTGSALASGGVTTAAYTIETGITLTDGNLATVAALNGVAVMQNAPSAAEKDAVASLIADYAAGVAPGNSFVAANGTSAEVTDVNAAGSDLALGESATVSMTPVELWDMLEANDGVAVLLSTASSEERRRAAKTLQLGRIPGLAVAGQ